MISHDLDLLDEAITRVLHLDRGGDDERRHAGRVQGHLLAVPRRATQDEERLAKRPPQQAKEIDRLQTLVDRFGAKATKAAMAHSLEKRIDRIQSRRASTAPTSAPRRCRCGSPSRRTPGRTVLEVEGLAKSYGALDVFDDVSFDVGRGERLLSWASTARARPACCASSPA